MGNLDSYRGGEFFFLQFLAEEIERGYTPGSTFRQESQLYVNRRLRTVVGPLYGPMFSDRYLKSKIKTLKKRYHEFSKLLSQKGIHWDVEDNIVYGNEKHLRAHYKGNYRKGGCPGEVHYDLMRQVFESGVKFK
ncbi:uncharacterized protein LOC127250806 [Andrographis paniculata]|uniref:uncharacterized protein LOC127250806 n=1 Tax=Andrographis paniculata TaxID=175694 RepID=UPI0021E8ECC4|nr:uncharacterized protein LOC127250806 [Andrographis paniculata]